MRTTDVTQKISKTWEEDGAKDVSEERWREWYDCYMTYTMCKMSKKILYFFPVNSNFFT